MLKKYTTHNYKETFDLGRAFAKTLSLKDVLFLSGDLGSGKTAFCCGLANGLGCIDEPSSPTYAILNIYRGPTPLAHFDMYRVATEYELESTGFFDYLDEDMIIAVEWCENIVSFSSSPTYFISFETVGTTTREIIIEEIGE
jgi:ATPase, YjeE family